MKKTKFPRLRNLKPKLILAFALILIVPSIVIGTRSFLAAKAAVNDELTILNQCELKNVKLFN